MTHEIAEAGKLAGLIKIKTPTTTTVVGGVHATVLPVETLRDFPSFDVLVHGEGEVTHVNAIGLMVPYPGTEVADMVKTGKGGYRLLSGEWADYNKQLGNALELEGISRRKMEQLQLIGYLKIPLWNHRVLGFLRFCWHHRRAAVEYLRKAS